MAQAIKMNKIIFLDCQIQIFQTIKMIRQDRGERERERERERKKEKELDTCKARVTQLVTYKMWPTGQKSCSPLV
jgi:hypothetical protein